VPRAGFEPARGAFASLAKCNGYASTPRALNRNCYVFVPSAYLLVVPNSTPEGDIRATWGSAP
jgi:hypothetical protein